MRAGIIALREGRVNPNESMIVTRAYSQTFFYFPAILLRAFRLFILFQPF